MRASLPTIGALAGAFSALVFTVVHQVLISAIWFALPAMLGAGAVCGACLAWSYHLVVPSASAASWLRYNLMFLLMFVVLGVVSVAVFDPTTTIAALLQTNEPPRALIGRALPMTGAFMVATAVVLSVLYRASWYGALSLLVTSTTLVLLLGLNISILGLVDVPSGEGRVLAETFGLLASLAVVYIAVVLTVARDQLLNRRSA